MPEERPGRRRQLLRLGLAAAIGLLVGISAVGLWGRHGGQTTGGPATSVPTSTQANRSKSGQDADRVDRPNQVKATLTALTAAVRADDKAAFLAAFDAVTASRALAERWHANLDRLPLASFSAGYLADDPTPLPSARQRALGGDAWTAQTSFSWQLRGFDPAAAHDKVMITFVQRGNRALIASVEDRPLPRQRRPVWLVGDLRVVSGKHSLVISLDPRAEPGALAGLADRAVTEVGRVWKSGWSRSAVVYLPGDLSQMAALLGAPKGTYSAMTAVTTTLADRQPAGEPARVVANPVLFAKLRESGRRLVLTHETAHLATRATTSAVPLWLAEGFADYIAFGVVPVPTKTVAAKLIADVRAGRMPPSLPPDADFAGGSPRLQQAYEGSWLAVRLIARRYGEDSLLELYRALDKASTPQQAAAVFAKVLGVSQPRFVAIWQHELRDLAD